MNIRELDEESRRTGVWPPRRIILRVEREDEADEASADGRTAPVKVGEVDLTAPPAPAPPKRAPAPLPAPSLSPSVTPSRRPGLPGSRGVTPAPAVSTEDAAFDKWLAEPLPHADSEPEYQPPPAWLPDDVRVRAERRHRRVARKARTQLFGASAATTLAVGGCAALLGLGALSQTESVGGSLGVPSIGVFGTAPKPASDDREKAAAPKPAADRSRAQSRASSNRSSSNRSTNRSGQPAPAAAASSGQSSVPARTSAPSAARAPAPARPAVNRPAARRAPANPPPPPPSPPPAPTPAAQGPAVVWNAPSSKPTPSAPSKPAATAPSRPVQTAPSRPAPAASTSSSPAP